MKTLRTNGVLLLAGALVAAAALAGCSKSLKNNFLPDIVPTVTLTSAPYDTTGRYFYAYKLNWLGNDPDGRVVSFVYAIDPKYNAVLKAWVPTSGWTSTVKNEQIIFFRASSAGFHQSTAAVERFPRVRDPRRGRSGGDVGGRDAIVLLVHRGARRVQILNPRPSHLLTRSS